MLRLQAQVLLRQPQDRRWSGGAAKAKKRPSTEPSQSSVPNAADEGETEPPPRFKLKSREKADEELSTYIASDPGAREHLKRGKRLEQDQAAGLRGADPASKVPRTHDRGSDRADLEPQQMSKKFWEPSSKAAPSQQPGTSSSSSSSRPTAPWTRRPDVAERGTAAGGVQERIENESWDGYSAAEWKAWEEEQAGRWRRSHNDPGRAPPRRDAPGQTTRQAHEQWKRDRTRPEAQDWRGRGQGGSWSRKDDRHDSTHHETR